MLLGPARGLEQLALGRVGDAVVAADGRQLRVVRTTELTGAVVVPALGAVVTDLVAALLRLDAEREVNWRERGCIKKIQFTEEGLRLLRKRNASLSSMFVKIGLDWSGVYAYVCTYACTCV